MSVRRRGKYWETRFVLEGDEHRFFFNGKKGQPVITKKQDAIDKESELRKSILAGTLVQHSDLKNFTKFFNEVFMDYSKKHKSPNTNVLDSIYGRRLLEEFGEKNLAAITPRLIEKFLVKMSETMTRFNKPHSPVTVRKYYNMLNQLFNMAVRERIVLENPCRLVNPSILKKFPVWNNRERWLNKFPAIEVVDKEGNKEMLTEEERLFRAFNEQGEHLKTISRIVLNTGIRPPHEILTISKERVNLTDEARYCKVENKDILIPPHAVLVTGKTGQRCVPLNTIAYKIFKMLVSDETTGDWLFTNRDGARMKTIKKGFAAAVSRAGIGDLHAYDLRHTFATRLVELGVHHYVISALLGHSTPLTGFGAASKITPGYAHVSWDSMVNAVGVLEEYNLVQTPFEKKNQEELDKIRTKSENLRIAV